MVQKRQLAEEEYDVSPKHLKLENSCQLVPSLEFPSKDVPLKPYTSGKAEGCFSIQISETDCLFESSKITDLPVCTKNDVGYAPIGRLSTSSWISSTIIEEDVRSVAPIITQEHNPLKPRTLIHPEDTYSYLLRSPPLKEVPVGPQYQANIPEWCGYDTKNVEDNIKFIGSCVIPMPEADLTFCDDNVIGRGRTDCCCENPGSHLCVQQHISEARENLNGNIGNERFLELGFDHMGDIVAYKWTDEDEQLFHEIIHSNPASLGKNFWDHLAESFPSRTRQEIVSYYFNVFVLQKRAEQNRSDPTNADSDDDEWQGSDSSDDDDVSCRDDIQEYGFSIKNPIFDYFKDTGFLHGGFDSSPPSDKTPVDDYDFQDDSCTSSSDSKVWDVGHFSFPKNKNDFLPTGSMIEEVFGVESWNFKVADNDK